MNAKGIPAPLSPGQAEPPLDASAANQIAMVVMLVPIAAPTTGVPPTPPPYVDSHDHVWLLVDKASPMAAVFEQITAPESALVRDHNHKPAAHTHSTWPDTSLGEAAPPDHATFIEALSRRELDV